MLKREANIRIVQVFYTFFGDITNYCNLRCPFCYNDWAVKKNRSNNNLTLDQFKQITPLFPLIAYSIHLSCAYEPTLNPQFHEILKAVPEESKGKVLFTTNLSTKISDELITAMGESGVNYIKYSSNIHEIRRMKFKGECNQTWVDEHDIGNDRWKVKIKQLRKSGYSLDFKPDTFSSIKRAFNKNIFSYFINDAICCFPQYTRLRLKQKPVIFFSPKAVTFTTDEFGLFRVGRGYGGEQKYSLDAIDDTYSFFKKLSHTI